MALAGTLEIQMIAGMARLQSDMNQAKTIVGGAMKNIEGAVAGRWASALASAISFRSSRDPLMQRIIYMI